MKTYTIRSSWLGVTHKVTRQGRNTTLHCCAGRKLTTTTTHLAERIQAALRIRFGSTREVGVRFEGPSSRYIYRPTWNNNTLKFMATGFYRTEVKKLLVWLKTPMRKLK